MGKKNKGNHFNNHIGRIALPKPNFNGQYQSRQIMLTISILVSGRMEDMERCIASLERLRNRVPCELILTDTGCPDEMQEWLKEKADKVLKFKWCDDFAAARNVGLRAARGQWFMFMDDDEWFEDTGRIEAFFLSGEFRRYQSASYIVRNYVNMEGTVWRDTHLTRMTLRRPETRFFYPIHESLWPLLEPEKILEDYAHHYGYASADPAVQQAKRERNLGILLKAIEEDIHCMKHYLQAVSEYYAMDDYDNAGRMADQGIVNCDPSRAENAVHIDGLYAAAVRMRLRGKRSLEVVRIGTDYLENVELSDLARASICSDLAIAYGELGEDKLSMRYLRDYLNWKKYFETHKEAWVKQETVVLDSCFENFQYRKVMGWGLAVSLSLGDAGYAEELLARGELVWWMDAARHWYVMTTDDRREKWQEDFRRLIERLGVESQPGRLPQAAEWEEDGQAYSHVRQLYEVLTMAEPERAAAAETEPERAHVPEDREARQVVKKQQAEQQSPALWGARQSSQSRDAGEDAVAQEIQALAVQLKEKVRFLIQQGQTQAALAIIGQLKGYFPADAELEELQVQCGNGSR